MKEFNYTGTCIPSMHYMVDIRNKIDQVFGMVTKGKYFTINRPRQYGKTTLLYLLEQKLLTTDDFLPIKISFEGFSTVVFDSEAVFCKHFLLSLGDDKNSKLYGYKELFDSEIGNADSLKSLSRSLTNILSKIDKKVVLMIDEVDKASNFDVLIHFLGILREKYLNSREDRDITFYSVILAGLHDVKTLKMRIRPESETKYNSPWNIAVEFEVDMSFNPDEIETMLIQYVNETGINLDTTEISDKLYFWTNGYPFLVSRLCKLVDEKIRVNNSWEASDIDKAAVMLLREKTTLFDSIVKNLENNDELFNYIQDIILGKEEKRFDINAQLVNLAFSYGLIERKNGIGVKIHNRIIEEMLTSYMIVKNNTEATGLKISNTQEPYIKPDGRLDFKKVMIKFQEAIKEKYSKQIKTEEFLENELRMLFLMFLEPIINGVGFSFKEVQTGAEKRLDIIIVFKDEKFIVELKLWKGIEYHEKGKKQLLEYMSLENIDKGYMLIANKTQKKVFKQEEEDGIFMVWV